MRNRAAPRSKRPSAEQPGSTSGSLTKGPPAPGKNMRKLSDADDMRIKPTNCTVFGGMNIHQSQLFGRYWHPEIAPQEPSCSLDFCQHPNPAPRPDFFGLPSFAASRALHSAVRFIAPRHSRRGLGVLAADQTPQGATAGEPTHVGAIGHQAAWGLVVMVLLENGSLW